MGGKMTVGELIDELLGFELNDKVIYLNLEISTPGVKTDLTLSDTQEFRVWHERTGPNRPKGEAAGVAAKGGD